MMVARRCPPCIDLDTLYVDLDTKVRILPVVAAVLLVPVAAHPVAVLHNST
jgi:hypothetical protein